jgi:hypothetical protein
MNDNQRFSILTFPQHFDGNKLNLNIVVMPRDQNPLSEAIEQHLTIPDAPAFAEAKLKFTANIFSGFSVFPHNHAPVPDLPLITTPPDKAAKIFEALASQLDITNLNTTNRNIDLLSIGQDFKPALAKPEHLTVRKYLPKSYRKAFNYTTPRHKNAVTDDSYHCAIKGGHRVPTFQRSGDTISWGKVYAYLMRQPFLAEQAGMIYHTGLIINPSHFPDGGWLYIDLAADSDYRLQLDTDHHFVKRYAARIPPLTANQARQVFAPLQFPVLFKAQANDPDPDPASNYDKLFIEAAEYDDGYAKIVHCQQPPNRDLLVEENDGAHPVKDVGIRLGWDDEQILIWYIRQLLADPSGELSGRIDAPLGVFGYCIDVREAAEPENPWETLNLVEGKQPLILINKNEPGNPIKLGEFSGELPYQVYPMQVDGQKDENYWLPMYFANWNGHSMVLPDEDAANIYQTTNVDVENDPEDPINDTGTGVSGPAQNQLNQIYNAGPINTELRYGSNYEFRIRLQDLSGGAPALISQPVNETASDISTCRFKRYLSPNQPRILEMLPSGNDDNILVNKDTPNKLTELNVQRPKLGYPAVVYTGKYTDPIQRLIDQAKRGIDVDPLDHTKNAEHRVGLGVADPDVDRIEITVEIATLSLDKLDSISGKDDYVHLYTTTRGFPAINHDDDYEAALNLPIEYRDVKVLHTGDEVDLINDLNLNDNIDNLTELVLPSARTVRLTIRAVCEEKADNHNYYGFIEASDKRLDNRYGEPFQVMLYSPSLNEEELLIQYPGVPKLQGTYLQPDAAAAFDGRITTLLFGKKNNQLQDNVQLLADRLKINSSKLTLTAPKGERIVFGCSSRIRHTLAPDNSSLTFAAKGDLYNHWLCCLSFELDRDWMWDALEYRSFVIKRSHWYTHTSQDPVDQNVVVGDIEMVRTASFESLHNPDRNSTRLVFIDVVEPKKEKTAADAEPDFPDTIDVEYVLEAKFKPDHAQQQENPEQAKLRLPITTPPAQVPKIVSAGIALSPYVRNEIYSATETRKRYLWIEFEEAVKDPNDIYFARVLANAPDQLISNNNLELLAAPEEPALPIDPELIRVITKDSSNDLAGLNAMQPMQKSTTSDRHYLLPLPQGLHADADEMFGFFTYEFRLGHYRNPTTDEMVWTTAQGRFGRRLRATGIQHPAPALTCMPNRDKEKLWVTAPYAVAVHDSKNVTADPPRTQLWAMLYAQVKQADNEDYRNILLDDRPLDWRVQVEPEKGFNVLDKYDQKQLETLKTVAFRNFKYEINTSGIGNLKLVDFSSKNKDAKKYGTTVWLNKEIAQLLDNLGLPLDSPLSVLVVETLPHITNIAEHITGLYKPSVAQSSSVLVASDEQPMYYSLTGRVLAEMDSAGFSIPSPVSEELGEHRILRTSPLTEVDGVCVNN